MRLMSVSGLNGSGKTALIKSLVDKFVEKGQRAAVIVNEEGREIYEPQWCETRLATIKYIRGGWVGCSLAASLVDRIKNIKRANNPDWLIIEPSEMVVTKELRDVAAMGLRDTRYDVGPLIALVDGPDFDFIWNERRHLVQGQINDADIVVTSRTDIIDKEKQETILRTLTPLHNGIYPLTVRRSSDVEFLFNRVNGFVVNAKR